MSEYTPGPWEYDAAGICAARNPDKYIVLRVSQVVDKWPANAALIAAAPALLEACEDARVFMAGLPLMPMPEPKAKPVQQKLIAAIPKAKGQT